MTERIYGTCELLEIGVAKNCLTMLLTGTYDASSTLRTGQ
ncbi:Uncharacterised protein [Bordetella pertussis]|nr:Uncharacterised protein [Bordetella pertussis]